MDKMYKGYTIQKTYCVISPDGSAVDYLFSLKEAKKCIDDLKQKPDGGLRDE